MERQMSETGLRSGEPDTDSRSTDGAAARIYALYLLIWGLQWLSSALLGFWSQWREVESYQQFTLGAALVLTLLAFMLGAVRSRSTGGAPLSRAGAPFLGAAALLAVLLYVQRVDWHLLPLMKGAALASGYMLAGARLGRPLRLLGLWMLVLTLVVGYWYLGYAPIVLGGFGGLSLIGAAGLIILGTRGEITT